MLMNFLNSEKVKSRLLILERRSGIGCFDKPDRSYFESDLEACKFEIF